MRSGPLLLIVFAAALVLNVAAQGSEREPRAEPGAAVPAHAPRDTPRPGTVKAPSRSERLDGLTIHQWRRRAVRNRRTINRIRQGMLTIYTYGAWDRLAECESGRRPANWKHGGSSYQGGLGFAASTWDAYRLPDYPAEAYHATREQQIMVGLVLVALNHGRWSPSWGCARSVGLP